MAKAAGWGCSSRYACCMHVSDLHEDFMVALAVGIEAVHQLLPAGPHQVLGQRQVPDGSIRRLIQVQATLIPQLPRYLSACVLQASHGIYQAEGKVLLQAQNGGVVCLHMQELAISQLAHNR